MRAAGLGLVAATLWLAPALAQSWVTTTEEDVFTGKETAVLIGSGSGSAGLHADCDADREITLAVLVPYADDKISGVASTIVLKVDDGETARLEAESYTHNDNYYGFRATETGDFRAMVERIGGARRSVLVGLRIEALDLQESFTIPANGSTRAAERFLAACS